MRARHRVTVTIERETDGAWETIAECDSAFAVRQNSSGLDALGGRLNTVGLAALDCLWGWWRRDPE